jgi:hypothetical protein
MGNPIRIHSREDRGLLLVSLALQLALGTVLGHAYDQRLAMATGYLVSSGQSPYAAQDLRAVFNNPVFQGMTSVGYPPPWPLVTGLIFRLTYAQLPNLLLYNLALKLPVIVANVLLACLVRALLRRLGASSSASRGAWLFMLFNPFVLYVTAAWGQIDSIVALLALAALVLLQDRRIAGSAVLLALAIAFKPTPLPLVPVVLISLAGDSLPSALRYALISGAALVAFCVAPFWIFGWDPTPILRNWNAHFTVGGGLSVLTFYELLQNRYDLPGNWWLLGLAWIPAVTVGLAAFRGPTRDLTSLLKKCLGLALIFFLTRTWVSEPNLMLLVPWVVILTATGELPGWMLWAFWIVPLVFTVFNDAPRQLLFPIAPATMATLQAFFDRFRTARLAARTLSVIPWELAGWWIVVACRRGTRPAERVAVGTQPVTLA